MQPSPLRYGFGDSADRLDSLYRLLWLFLFALAIRWTYILVIYATMGDGGLLAADSRGFMEEARKFVDLVQTGKLPLAEWLGVNTAVMPLFSWLLALNVAIFGDHAALSYVMTQGVIDAATCLLVYRIAEMFGESIAMPAAVAAAINPVQIVLAGLVYTDTPFLFFVAVMLFGALRWMKTATLCAAVIIGIGLGGAALIRIMIVPWAPVLCVFLLGVQAWRRSLTFSHLRHAILAAAIFCLCIAPVLLRNVAYYDAWALTSQSGYHLAYWIVPLVKEAKDGTPWEKTARELQKREREQRSGPIDNFKSSAVAREVGLTALRELGYPAIVKAWVVGAAINIASPAIILSPPVAQLPRTGFYGTSGANPLEKILNFVFRSDNRSYAWALILGITGIAIIRLLQLVGFIAVVRTAPPANVVLLVLWVSFVLAVNGPVASPKYRLPIEPALCLLTGAGFVVLRDWRWRRRLLKG